MLFGLSLKSLFRVIKSKFFYKIFKYLLEFRNLPKNKGLKHSTYTHHYELLVIKTKDLNKNSILYYKNTGSY